MSVIKSKILRRTFIIATITILAFWFFYVFTYPVKSRKYEIVFDISMVNSLDHLKKRAVVTLIDKTVEDVYRYFGTEYRDTLHVYFSDVDIAWSRNAVHIRKRIDKNLYGVVYCVAHAVLKVKPSAFEMEGPAHFIAYKSAPEGEEIRMSKIRYCSFLSNQVRSHDLLFEGGDDVYYFRDNWETGYQAGLFYYFLNEKYGTPKLREFYAKGIRNFQSVYGMSTETAYAEWRLWLIEEVQKASNKSQSATR
ncbi:MAG: hypothetical protein OEM52_14110 [bacterium]|nr:hypothetical protein [bacterium]